MTDKVIARYSRTKCLAWSIGFVAVSVYILRMPLTQAGFDTRYISLSGGYWLALALGSIYMIALSIGLLSRAFLLGGQAITMNESSVTVLYPWSRKEFLRSEIQSIQAGQYEAVFGQVQRDYLGLKLPFSTKLNQLEIVCKNGEVRNVRSGLLTETAEAIATRLNYRP